MKLLALLSLYLLLAFSTHAQALSWLHGDWTGETYFPNGPITKRIIVKMRVTRVSGNRFEALLDNLYPNDTTIRLERKITGHIINKKMSIESSEQVYIRDPRTQNFWRDCTGCDIQSGFSIGDKQVEIKLSTNNCSDECNGETTFSRDTSELNPDQHKDLAKWFRFPAPKPIAKADKKPPAEDSAAVAVKAPVSEPEKITVQKQDIKITDRLPDIQNVQTATDSRTNQQSQKPVPDSSQKTDSVVLSSPVKQQTTVSATLRTGDSSMVSKLLAPKKPVSASIQKKDSLTAKAMHPAQVSKDSLAKPKADSIPNALTTRTTNLVTTFRVSSPHIIIQLFDNAEIDGDMVTVYHNGQLIVNHQSLTHKAITITIDASKESTHHEFIMVADNLGLIPPNTALMRITAGEQKFELEVSSDFDNNSKITIDYTGE